MIERLRDRAVHDPVLAAAFAVHDRVPMAFEEFLFQAVLALSFAREQGIEGFRRHLELCKGT